MKISELQYSIDEDVTLQLKVLSVRDQKHMIFIISQDFTGTLQLFISKKDLSNHEEVSKLLPGSYITAYGKIVKSTQSKTNGMELQTKSIKIESYALPSPITEETDISLRFDKRVVDLKSEKNQLMLKVRSCFEDACRKFCLNQKGLTEIHTPKLMGTASESGSQVFKVNYFDKFAYLAQSPQFYKQMAIASGLEGAFEIGPIFRAEESHSSRHMTEFVGLDVELAWVTKTDGLIAFETNMLLASIQEVSIKYGFEIQRLFGQVINPPVSSTITIDEAKKILKTHKGINLKKEDDLSDEHEKLLYEVTSIELLFITDYPTSKRPFYHKYSEDGTTQSFDAIYRGIEITTGALREHRLDILSKQAIEKGVKLESIDTYLDNFRYGCPPHGGFGLGIERVIQKIFNFSSVKEAAFLPRDPERLTP